MKRTTSLAVFLRRKVKKHAKVIAKNGKSVDKT